ncbi:riboflavin biosynthesis protein RibD [Alkalilimnicola ehrlichii]|nr:riboflavin biosynthesis protein RibD [Alkalilimnicola ehrlichii]
MAQALALAERGRMTTQPNPRVGCVIVREGKVVGSGWHRIAGGAHAEVYALREAGADAKGATAYVTLEPCSHHGRTPPCCDALIEAGVGRVVAAMEDPNPRVAGSGLERLRAAGIETAVGLLKTEAEALNGGFAKRMRSGQPRVLLKLATSLDGRTAMASGESKWITSPAARRDVHRLRAEAGAMLTGIGTVLADDPSLTVREFPLPPPREQQPLRVVVDSDLRMSPEAAMLRLPGQTLIVCGNADEPRRLALREAGAEVVALPDDSGRVDLRRLMSHLAEREINDVMVEAGPTLGGALVQAGLVDELVIYQALHLMGHEGRPLLALSGLTSMAQRVPLALIDVKQIGPDLRVRVQCPAAPTGADEEG